MKIQTAPARAHRSTINTAAHTRKERHQAQREMSRAEMMRAGMRASLNRFKRTREQTKLIPAGWFIIRAISHETGEIRYYVTQYQDNFKFIGNTDYLSHGREETDYDIFIRTADEESSYRHIQTAHGKGKPTEEETRAAWRELGEAWLEAREEIES